MCRSDAAGNLGRLPSNPSCTIGSTQATSVQVTPGCTGRVHVRCTRPVNVPQASVLLDRCRVHRLAIHGARSVHATQMAVRVHPSPPSYEGGAGVHIATGPPGLGPSDQTRQGSTTRRRRMSTAAPCELERAGSGLVVPRPPLRPSWRRFRPSRPGTSPTFAGSSRRNSFGAGCWRRSEGHCVDRSGAPVIPAPTSGTRRRAPQA
jgi:hypothetical protein